MKCMRTVLALAALAAPPVLAEGQSWVQGKGAAFESSGCNCIKTGPGFGLGVGTWFDERWGMELEVLATTLESRHGQVKAGERHLTGSGLFGLWPGQSRWVPYLRAGAGVTQVQAPYSLGPGTVVRPAFHVGAGVQHFFGTRGLASLEGRSVTIRTAEQRTEYQALLGLGYRWGARTAAPAPAPAAPVPVLAPPVLAPAFLLAPEPAPVPPAPKAVTFVLDEALLHFANDQAELPGSSVAAIRQVAVHLKAYPGDYTLRVTGHSSSVGGAAHNLELSRRRAEAVAKVLAAEGIAEVRMTVLGLGETQPIADNATRQGQARNRRVEIEIKAPGANFRQIEAALQD